MSIYKSPVLASVAAVVAFGVAAAQAAPVYTLTPLAIPSATQVSAAGINDAGMITGWYSTATASNGFIEISGGCTT